MSDDFERRVTALQGNAVKREILGSAQDGFVLTWDGTEVQWKASALPSVGTLSGDVVGPLGGNTVVRLTGTNLNTNLFGSNNPINRYEISSVHTTDNLPQYLLQTDNGGGLGGNSGCGSFLLQLSDSADNMFNSGNGTVYASLIGAQSTVIPGATYDTVVTVAAGFLGNNVSAGATPHGSMSGVSAISLSDSASGGAVLFSGNGGSIGPYVEVNGLHNVLNINCPQNTVYIGYGQQTIFATGNTATKSGQMFGTGDDSANWNLQQSPVCGSTQNADRVLITGNSGVGLGSGGGSGLGLNGSSTYFGNSAGGQMQFGNDSTGAQILNINNSIGTTSFVPVTVSLTSSTDTLTVTQSTHLKMVLSGTLTADETLIFPNADGIWFLDTSQVTIGTFNVTLQSGTGMVSVTSLVGGIVIVMTDGNNHILAK